MLFISCSWALCSCRVPSQGTSSGLFHVFHSSTQTPEKPATGGRFSSCLRSQAPRKSNRNSGCFFRSTLGTGERKSTPLCGGRSKRREILLNNLISQGAPALHTSWGTVCLGPHLIMQEGDGSVAGGAAGQGTWVPESPHGTELPAYSRLRTIM